MDIGTITSLVGSLGFPIVCSGALFWYMIKQQEKHDEEIKKLTEVINNNTNVLMKLCNKLGVDEDE